jgi:hypothetical protein
MPSEQRGRFKQKAPAFRHDVIGHTAACTAAGSSSDQPERALRFLARLDRHLLTLADQAARRDFLDRQLEDHAITRVSSGSSVPDRPQASGFLLTIVD